MYLKRLELQGFKSFNVKTMFDFEPGITAVVGPNGSGKSNVAESLRWVLGEQSSRNVRARRLEDVIFSGSSQKAAVGMAEVSITLDNTEGWLPVDYTEVVVSRRAYRNGDSDYLINKNKVRLRDVLDLFQRAQVGQNSYAFMGQGLVEEVLVMRPEERRRLLEEAADVRLLRSRLDEARARLAATRENLERVNLLIEEIGPRLKQLERQASRAAEHARLAQELAATLRELYGQQWSDAQEALLAARAAFEQKQQALVVARDETKACEEGLVALRAALEEREKELGARRQRWRALNDETHALEQRLTFDRERIDGQTKRRAEVEADLTSLRDERGDLQRSIATAREREQAIRPEIEDAKSLLETRRQELNTLEQEHGGVRRRIAETEEKVERARRAMRDTEASLSRLTEEEARSQGEGQRRLNQRNELIAGLKDVGIEFKAQNERLALLEDEMEEGEQERLNLLSILETSRSAAHSLESELIRVNGALGQIQARYDLLRRLQASQEGLESGARYLVGARDGPDDAKASAAAEGLVGLVRDIIHVPPGLERAIEASLAENVQALVFENLGAALAAIETLEQRAAGRATVYALDAVRTAPPLNLLREKGVIGVAARLVRCENHFRPLVDVLLGRTIVVEDVNLARDVLKRGLGAVVTVDGVLLRPNGALSGGLNPAAGESFSRQRELDELPEDLAAGHAKRVELEQRLRREREESEGAADALAQVEPRLQAQREEVRRRQNELLKNRGKLILLRSEGRSLWTELRRGDEEHDWRGRRARLIKDGQGFEAEAKIAGESLGREREALSALNSRRNGAIDSVSEAAAAQADLEGEAKSLARQAELLQANLGRTEGQVRGRENSLKEIDAEVVTLQERRTTVELELSQKREELAALVAETEPAEGELNHLRNRERGMREQLSAASAKMLAAERANLEAESAVKLHGDEIEALRETMTAEGFRIEGGSVLPADAVYGPSQQGGRPPIRGGAEVSVESLRRRIGELRHQIRGLGPVNEQAQADYGESKERYDFLSGQVADLVGSEETLLNAIDELESNIRVRLTETFAIVDAEFQKYFESFFNGGSAKLGLTNPDDMANSGIEIIAQPPGKRVNTLAMLSGGERALTSLALLLSLLAAHPSPICVLDEVDAALDERNVGRFVDALVALEKKTQFVIITHNPRTIEAADVIYGISMGADSTSKVLSLRLDDIKKN